VFLLISFSFTAMTLFCLAMPKHREQVLARELPLWFVASFRTLAWILLALTFYISVDFYGWSIGPALFFGALSGALLPLILSLTYYPKVVPLLATLLPVLAYFISTTGQVSFL